MVGKKAYLFSSTLIIIGAIIFFQEFSYSSNMDQLKQATKEIYLLDKFFFDETYLSQGYRLIFFNFSGVEIEKRNNSIIFKENLPNPNATIFIEKNNKWKEFISRYESIQINNSKINMLKLIVKEQDISYYHNSFGSDAIIFDVGNSTGAQINITSPYNITNHNWDPLVEGTYPIRITVYFEGEKVFDDSQELSIADFSKLELGTISGDIILNTSNSIYINNKIDKSIFVKTKLDFLEKEITVRYPELIVLNRSNVIKIADIRLI